MTLKKISIYIILQSPKKSDGPEKLQSPTETVGKRLKGPPKLKPSLLGIKIEDEGKLGWPICKLYLS